MRDLTHIWETLAMATLIPRRIGKTTALIQAAKKIDACFIVANNDQSRQIRSEFQIIKVLQLDIFFNDQYKGLKGPFIFDHFAQERLWYLAKEQLVEKEKIIKNLEKRLQELENKL